MGRVALSDEVVARIVDSVTSAVPAKAIYIFGSRARGDDREDSDVDIYVVLRDECTDRFSAASSIAGALLWMPMPKDVIAAPVSRFEQRRGSLSGIERAVDSEGVKIYG